MERTKKVITPELIGTHAENNDPVGKVVLTWKKIGGGSLRWNNRIIKPGEIFEAALEDLPKAFMDTLVCQDAEGLNKVETAVKKEALVIENLYKLVKSKTEKGLWNVVGDNGKPINDVPLEKGSAEELLAAVNG